ncbi:MAG: type transporter, partial [Bacteroidetes bacterium]|nr:type transporter [Bacteroidota bacterium]
MEYTTIIKPKNRLFEVNLKEIWQYRDLFTMFVKRDIVTQYKQTVLGPTWYLIQPALTTIMYMVVFGGIAKISTDGLPQPLFYLAGIVVWQYFSDCLNKTSSTFTANQNIFGKVYFP